MNRKFFAGFNLFFSAVGITGSFILSFAGNVPCFFCWTARISMMVIFLFSMVELIRSHTIFFLITSLASAISAGASGYLIYLDFKPKTVCIAQETCYSPLFMGIPASVYAFLLSVGILVFSLVAIFGGEKAREV